MLLLIFEYVSFLYSTRIPLHCISQLRALVEVVTEESLRAREEEQQDDAWAQEREEFSRGFTGSPQKLPIFGKSVCINTSLVFIPSSLLLEGQ